MNLKRRGFIGFLCFIICFVSGCKATDQKVLLSELSADDISQIIILALKTEKMTNVTQVSEIERILSSIKELPLYAKSELNTVYDTDLIQFTLHLRSGEEIIVEVMETWISYNQNWFACDASTCEKLSGLAYEYLP